MKTTLVLRNEGTRPTVSLALHVSYFVKAKTGVQIDSQRFSVTLKPAHDELISVDFGTAALTDHEVMLRLQQVEGSTVTQKQFILGDVIDKEALVAVQLNEEINPDATPEPPAEPAHPAFVYGRLLDKKGVRKMDDVQIIILVQTEAEGNFVPLTTVRTEAQGYFAMDYPVGTFIAATAQVGLNLTENPIPIKLEPQKRLVANPDGGETEVTELVFPRRVILVANLADATTPTPDAGDCDCGCTAGEFDQKRVLEEFSFYSLVRTSEPAIKGYVLEDEDELTLGDILRQLPYTVFELLEPLKALPFIARESPLKTTATIRNRSRAAAAADDFLKTIETVKIRKGVLADFLKDEKTITKENISKLFTLNEIRTFQTTLVAPLPPPRPLGRVELGPTNTVDWDDEPTIYQAVEVAHGHLLHFKSEWVADGYSLGDLLYSLPLAPGQKKQLVVFDWERRESAANSQSVDVEESLSNSLSRDRDILEIARGTTSENLRGSSRASTGGVSGSAGGVLGGVLFGVSGGYSTSSSRASQDSFRQVSSSDQQRLSDRLMQSANSVRSMRSTVIQTVSQGERFEVSSESVANYNHCHALTIQYYEVLRHFKIRQRFAEARECLFVPLLMSSFDLKKMLRWREPLAAGLLDRRLRAGFDAGDRVAHEWQDSNFPSGTFASEPIITASGQLQFRFSIQRPLDDIVEVDDTERPPVFAGGGGLGPIWHKKKVGRIIEANWAKLRSVVNNPTEFYTDFLANAADKDAVFHQMLGERIARQFVDSLLFTVQNEGGNGIGAITFDPSVSSRYVRNGLLTVSLRIQGPTGLPRDRFHYLRIGIDPTKDVLTEGSFATVQSGSMRYRTRHHSDFLFRYQRLNDDLTANDAATIYTGPTDEELKDPRKEDLVLVNKLIAHLNDNLEYYHERSWLGMSEKRRFMLLDGIFLSGKGEGRSLASLVQNELLAIVGNSLVFPVAPGLNLNPDFGMKESLTEFYMTATADPVSVSVPTKGVFAEAVMGKCNSCEKIDDSRFWRWEESPIPDSPTAISPISTDSRRADPGTLQPSALPQSLVSIQNAPNAPDPTGLAATLGVLGQASLFKDITGLAENQKNAIQTFQTSMEAAKTIAQEAAKLDVQKTMERRLDRSLNAIDNDKSLSPAKKAELKEKALNAYMGSGATTVEPEKPKDPSNAQFKEGMQLIDDLQKGGALTPEQAKTAKENLAKKYAESGASEAKAIIESAAQHGVEATVTKPDGTKVDVKKPGGVGISGRTELHTMNLPHLKDHEGYENKFRFKLTLNDRTFVVELVNDSNDFAEIGPLHAKDESSLTLTGNSLRFGTIVPLNPKSTTQLYEGTVNAGREITDFLPGGMPMAVGIRFNTTKSDLHYTLPFAPGTKVPCVQGRGGAASHTGAQQFAVDLGVPRGTKVLAAMDGLVVDIVRVHPNQDIGTRGTADTGNIIRVRHDDLSYAVYGHLTGSSINVTVGQRVNAGDLLALSGNSGNTNGDHLHFAVERRGSPSSETIDWDFYDANGQTYVPVTNSLYEQAVGLAPGQFSFGNGSPEGTVAGNLGDIYAQLDGTPGSLYYVKATGAAGTKTGWVAKAVFP
ncbi:M23 family metallopeptidase [Fibrella aquatilis]|uniref:M23 family metallopeptidase n=1 Tax=Fibrella aquatilis TaxID=2817059 RepID=A0A939G9W7_9BACT|nr:M23 family metallopeptidase [Fibrella aquatilis]MBO0933344.1 M23 family metallopeptidase [Fibrella aquatilis]